MSKTDYYRRALHQVARQIFEHGYHNKSAAVRSVCDSLCKAFETTLQDEKLLARFIEKAERY